MGTSVASMFMNNFNRTLRGIHLNFKREMEFQKMWDMSGGTNIFQLLENYSANGEKKKHSPIQEVMQGHAM